MTHQSLLFCTRTYEYLAQELLALGGFEPGKIERKTFPDGEYYRRIVNQVSGRDVILLGGTVSDSDTLEIYDLACAAVKYGARTLTLVIPWFGYSTMERATKPGEVVMAKSRARLLSSIPMASLSNRILMVDLHSEGIPHYFEGNLTTVHIYAKPLILDLARELGGNDFVMACTDAGRAKWVESLANDLGVHASFVFKRRISGEETEVTGVSAQVKDKAVVIYDDMIRTGGSLMGAARAYKAAGARSISAITTHGVFPGDAWERLQASGLFDTVASTNTHPNVLRVASAGARVVSIAPILAPYLMEIV